MVVGIHSPRLDCKVPCHHCIYNKNCTFLHKWSGWVVWSWLFKKTYKITNRITNTTRALNKFIIIKYTIVYIWSRTALFTGACVRPHGIVTSAKAVHLVFKITHLPARSLILSHDTENAVRKWFFEATIRPHGSIIKC